MADALTLNEREVEALTPTLMHTFINYMYNYFMDPLHKERIKTQGIGRLSASKQQVVEAIKQITMGNFVNIPDDPHLIIGIFKYLVNDPSINTKIYLFQCDCEPIMQIRSVCRAICMPSPAPENINKLQEAIEPFLLVLQEMNLPAYRCMLKLFSLCNQIITNSNHNNMNMQNIIIAMQSILIVIGIKPKLSGDSIGQMQLSLGDLPFENAIFEVLIESFNKKELNMADTLTTTTSTSKIDQEAFLEVLDERILDDTDSVNKATNLLAIILANKNTTREQLDAVNVAIDAGLTTADIDDDFASSGNPRPPMVKGLAAKKKDIVSGCLELLDTKKEELLNIINHARRIFAEQKTTFDQTENLAERLQLIRTEIDNIATKGLSTEVTTEYNLLLQEELSEVTRALYLQKIREQVAQQHFDSHNFAAIADPVARQDAMQAAIDAISALGLEPGVAALYTQLLIEARNAIQTQLDAAQGRFNAHDFANIADPVARHTAMQAAINNAAALELHANETARYTQLLTEARDAVQAQLNAAQDRFNALNLDAIADPIVRQDAMQAAINNVDALGLHADEAARYAQLLTEARDATAAEIDRVLRARFDALTQDAHTQETVNGLTALYDLIVNRASAALREQLLSQITATKNNIESELNPPETDVRFGWLYRMGY